MSAIVKYGWKRTRFKEPSNGLLAVKAGAGAVRIGRDEPGPKPDIVGALLVICWLSWIIAASVMSGGNPRPMLYLVAGSALTMYVSRLIAGRVRVAIPAAVTILAVLIGWNAGLAVLGRNPLAGPFGYSNANAAFFIQSVVAGLMLVRAGSGRLVSLAGMAAAIGFALVPLLNGSTTGIIVLGILVPGALLVQRWRGPRSGIAFCAGFWAVVLAGTTGLGALYEGGAAPRGAMGGRVVESLSERRLILWDEALTMATEHPVTGVGPGGFAQASPTVRADRDVRFAHHEFLQHAAEVGVVGFVLMTAVFAWGFMRLGFAAGPDGYGVLPAVSWAALGAHASLDYVLHFAAVPLTAACLVGASIGAAERSRRHTRNKSGGNGSAS